MLRMLEVNPVCLPSCGDEAVGFGELSDTRMETIEMPQFVRRRRVARRGSKLYKEPEVVVEGEPYCCGGFEGVHYEQPRSRGAVFLQQEGAIMKEGWLSGKDSPLQRLHWHGLGEGFANGRQRLDNTKIMVSNLFSPSFACRRVTFM